MRLIPNWKRAHRMISVQLMAIVGAIQGAWPTIPEEYKSALPLGIVHWISILLVIAAIGGRLIDQGSTTEPKA